MDVKWWRNHDYETRKRVNGELMNEYRTKVFSAESPFDLEKQIDKFFFECAERRPQSIGYSVFVHPKNNKLYYSAVVIYEFGENNWDSC